MKKTFILTYPSGIHARPSTVLCGLAKDLDVEVTVISSRGEKADITNVLAVLALGLQPGEITFEAKGKDAKEAMERIEKFIHNLNTSNRWD